MKAEKKVIDGILPITTTSAVYLNGTSTTLQEAIENGNLGDFATKEEMQNTISEIELTPGPQGPKGDTGERGPQGLQGAKGADGLTTSITVNGTTYNHSNGKITLPDYPSIIVTSEAEYNKITPNPKILYFIY